jgi:zinc protease
MRKTRNHIVLMLSLSLCSLINAQNKTLDVERYKLKNGLEIEMIQVGSIPAVSLACYVNVGKKAETPGQQYLSQITVSGLLRGNEKYSRLEQDNLLNRMGATMDASSNDNFSKIKIRFLSKDAAQMLDVFSSALLKPLFPADEFKQQIEETLDYNNPYKMDITDIAWMYSNYVVFGTAHPLGRHFYASQLNKLTVVQLKEFYQFNYTPGNTKLVLAGNFDRAKMKELLEARFGSWVATFGENNKAAYETEAIKKKEYFFVNKKKATQTCLHWNKKAPEASSKDVIPFLLANNAFNVLLFDEIRAKEGKTYGIQSGWSEADNNGIFAVYTQVRNEVAYETTISFDRVLKQFYDAGVTQEQLNKAKEGLKSQRLSLENPFSVIDFFNPILFKDLAKRNEYIASIDAITLEQVNKTLKKYYTPDCYKLVMVGDEAVLTPQLQKIPGLVILPVTSIEKDN